MATPKQQIQQPKKHHYIRTIISSLFGTIALILVLTSILAVWLNRTLTNTEQFVSTTAPLVTKPDVQNFIVDKASSAILDNHDAPIGDIAQKLLTPEQIAGKSDAQLRTTIQPIVQDSIRAVIASPAFATLWATNSRAVHAQLISQLNNATSSVRLDFHPLITGVIDELGQTKLSFVKDKLDIKPDVGQVTLQGKQLDTIRKVFNYFKTATLVVLGSALLSTVLAVLVSVHHLKTIRRILLATGIFAGLLFAALSATAFIHAGGRDVLQQKMAIALVNGLTAKLRLSLLIIAIVGIGGAIGSKIYSVVSAHRKSA